MNDQPRQKLLEILNKRGEALLQNPKLLEDLLRDHCAEHRPEVVALMNAHREGIPAALLAELEHTSEAILVGRLRLQLQTHQSMETEAARWAVETWREAVRPFSAYTPVEEVIEVRKEPPLPKPTPTKLTAQALRELALAKLRVDPKGEFLMNLLIEKGADASSAAAAIDDARKQLAAESQPKVEQPWWLGPLTLLGFVAIGALCIWYLVPPIFTFFMTKWGAITYAFNSGDYTGAFIDLAIASAAAGGLWILSQIIKKITGN